MALYQNLRIEEKMFFKPRLHIGLAPIAVLTLIFHWGMPEKIQAEPPALPQGLEEDASASDGDNEANSGDGPALPSGLGEPDEQEGPDLPSGLGDEADETEASASAEKDTVPLRRAWREHVIGFWEVRGGFRTRADPHEKDESLGEMRLQLEADYTWHGVTFAGRVDFVYDPVLDHHDVNMNTGEGWLDLREASVNFTPMPFMDVVAGRQILTWGTGDFLFLNDMFPKDYRSFFIGRDVEYLKAPSDAVKVSMYSDIANLDVVYTPRFDHDRIVRGWRLSSFRGGRFRGRDAILDVNEPDDWFTDDEIAMRLHKRIAGLELAAYGYRGFWKSPGGRDPQGQAIFPELNVYGASVRGTIKSGIANAEVAYYDSVEDRDGDDPRINNDELRFLAGYKRDLPMVARDFSLGLQYYLEWMQDYEAYERSLPPGTPEDDEYRHVVTCRLRKQFFRQTLTPSLFTFYSPSGDDAYLRPQVNWDVTNDWTLSAGANLFFSEDDHTAYGRFKRNTNVYASLRYSF